jgi:signal peptide peptidase SppA
MAGLLVRYARLSDYAGPWLIHPPAFEAMFEVALKLDLASHIRAAAGAPPQMDPGYQIIEGKNGQKVAMVQMVGPMMKGQSSMGGASTIATRRAIRTVAANPEISGIVLAIDSPGGTVAGTQDLATDVRSASRKKPIVAHIDDLGASAAYWVASQADEVWANAPTALVGSVGTMVSVTDTVGRAERLGIRERVFSTGPLKSVGGDEPITDEQAAYLQSMVDGLQEEFDAAVKRGRRLSASQMAEVRTGAVFPAGKAQSLGLINGVRSLGATLDSMLSTK